MPEIEFHKLMTPESSKIFDALMSNSKAQVRFVGGCIRDMLLSQPIKDRDLATNLKPSEILNILEDLSIKAVPTGIEFGTITALIDDAKFEITTLRSDIFCDGRHAKVAFTDDWQVDAARRDFTINAMSVDEKGNLYDYFQGGEDLSKLLVKFIGNPVERIMEDHLRILRFLRFTSKLGASNYDPESLQACIKHMDYLDKLSSDRMRQEMFKWFTEGINGILLINDAMQPLLHKLFGDRLDIYSYGLIASFAKDEYTVHPLLSLSALITDMHVLRNIEKYWRLSRQDIAYISLINKSYHKVNVHDWDSEIKNLIIKHGRMLAMDIALLACAKHHVEVDIAEEIFEFIKQWNIPIFPITGKDIVELGLQQGPAIGKVLDYLEQYWQENDFKPSAAKLKRVALTHINQNAK